MDDLDLLRVIFYTDDSYHTIVTLVQVQDFVQILYYS